MDNRKEHIKEMLKRDLPFWWAHPAFYVSVFGTAGVVRGTYIWKTRIQRQKEEEK